MKKLLVLLCLLSGVASGQAKIIEGKLYPKTSAGAALSTGSVPFLGSSGDMTQDNANLFWDDSANRLGVGTATPTTTLDVAGSAHISGALSVDGAFAIPNYVEFQQIATPATPAATKNRIYFKSTNVLYTLDSTGFEQSIVAAGNAPSAQQYLKYGNSGYPEWSTIQLDGNSVAGSLPMSKGGTNKNLTAVAGALTYTDADSFEVGSVGVTGQVLTSGGSGAYTWTTDGGGNVVGPASATDNGLARFDTTTGKLLQDSAATLGDAGAMVISAAAASLQVDNATAASKMVYNPATIGALPTTAQLDLFSTGGISGLRQQGQPASANATFAQQIAQQNNGTTSVPMAVGGFQSSSTTPSATNEAGYVLFMNATDASGLVRAMTISGVNNSTHLGVRSGSSTGTTAGVALRDSSVGRNSLRSLTTGGDDNSGFGYDAGRTITTGTKNTHVGSGADVTSATLTNAASFGYNAKVDASNYQVFGDPNVTNYYLGSADTTPNTRFLYGAYASGANVAGGDLTIGGSQSTGTGAGGAMNFTATPASIASSSTVNLTATPEIKITPGTSVTGATTAIQAQAAGQTLDILQVKNSSAANVIQVASNGGLQLTGGAAAQTSFTDSAGFAQTTSVYVPRFNPGAYANILAIELPSTADITADAMVVLDARAGASRTYPSFMVTSPNEYAWGGIGFDDGTNSKFYLDAAGLVDGVNLLVVPDFGLRMGDLGTSYTYPFTVKGATGDVGIGDTSPDAQLDVQGDSDQIQLRVTGFAGQTADLFRVESGAPATKFAINSAGAVGVSGATGSTGQVLTSSGPTAPPTWATPSVGASGATGSVQFATGGALSSDNANFFWDDTNNRLGLGTAGPTSPLHVKKDANDVRSSTLRLENAGAGANTAPSVEFNWGQFISAPFNGSVNGSVSAFDFATGPTGSTVWELGSDGGFYMPGSTPTIRALAAGADITISTEAGTAADLFVRTGGDQLFKQYDGATFATVLALYGQASGTPQEVGISSGSPETERLRINAAGGVSLSDTGGNGGNVFNGWSRVVGTPTAAGSCTASCANPTKEKAVGGRCAHSAAIALQNAGVDTDTSYSCDYLAYVAGNCTATVVCTRY